MPMHEVFEHTADIGLRVRAATPEELFTEAARGLFALVVNNPNDVQPRGEVQVSIAGNRDELDYLLFDWLNELLYLFDSRQLLLAEFDVQFTDAGLQAKVRGEPLDATRHRLEHELKAITYHGLKVAKDGDAWLAEIVLDI
jgi:SHS2 domain-containing protein